MSAYILNMFNFFNYRDKILGFLSSLVLHVLLLTIGGVVLIKPVQYGVEVGKSGIEIHLVAAPQEAVVEAPVAIIEEPVIKEPVIVEEQPIIEIPKEEIVPVVEESKQEILTQGKDDVNYHSSGGAVTEAKPEYFRNPAPPYPLKARQQGFEGVVILNAIVGKDGLPVNVEIDKGSGYEILDAAALKAVRKWKFHPAQLGNIPVESTVQLSIRFELQK